jgi:hypothetical protein
MAGAGVYQTFPPNVTDFFIFNPLTPIVLWAALFWILIDDDALAPTSTARRRRLVAAVVFLFTISYSIATAVFFIGSFALAAALLSPSSVSPRRYVRYVVLPLAAGKLFHALEMKWVSLTIAGAKLTGNLNFADFLWRSGLDGSRQYYDGASDVLTHRFMSMGYMIAGPVEGTQALMSWRGLFAAAVASLAANAFFFTRAPRARTAMLFLAGAVGCYLFSLFVFSQGIIIHPDCWDVVIAFPLIVSLFVILPANVAARGRAPGLAVWIAVAAAFCYSFAQLRGYAVTFPVHG